MWFPSEQEAVEIFAAHFEARHRSGAVVKAKETARRLKSKGDEKGFGLWKKVATRVEELRKMPRVRLRREFEGARASLPKTSGSERGAHRVS